MSKELVDAYMTTIKDLEIELNSCSPFEIFKIGRLKLQIIEVKPSRLINSPLVQLKKTSCGIMVHGT